MRPSSTASPACGLPSQPTRTGASPTSGSSSDEACVERIANELGARGQPQLLLDMSAVRFHGSHAQEELLGDLAVRVPERDELEHLALPVAQVVALLRRRVLGRDAGTQLRVK